MYIYRLLTVNTIDEKIYQRQLTKTGLSDQMMAIGSKDSKDCTSISPRTFLTSAFTQDELRDIFTFRPLTGGCQTRRCHGLTILTLSDDLLDCSCQGRSIIEMSRASSITEGGNEDDDVSDDEKEGSFVMASQYDERGERERVSGAVSHTVANV